MAVFGSGQVSVTSSATQIIASYSTGTAGAQVAISNLSDTETVYLGSSSGVTTGTGFPLRPNETLVQDFDTIGGTANLYGITGSGTATVAYLLGA